MDQFKKAMASKPVVAVVAAGCGVCCAFLLVYVGLLACTLNPCTQALSAAFSTADISPYSQEALGRLALAGKEYTFDTNDLDALQDAISAEQAQLAYVAPGSERYTLDSEAISHLDDVYAVVQLARLVALIALALAVAGFAHLRYYGKQPLAARAMVGAGVGVLAVFAVAGAWAAVDFYGLFQAFHGLFFSAGSWVFSYDSLLICMYPENFWVGMGAIWLATTCLLSILYVCIGAVWLRRLKNQAAKETHDH